MRALILALLASIAVLPANAQSDVKSLSHQELIQACLNALSANDPAERYAEELVGRSGFNLRVGNQLKGENCLKRVYGVPFEFKNNRFASPVLLEQMMLEEEERRKQRAVRKMRAQALRREREENYLTAVIQICIEEYSRDRFRALTTPICGEVFKVQGLPD